MNGPCTNVWLAHPDSLSVALIDAAASSILSQRERGRSKRFCFERDRVQYVVAHAIARTAIARVAGCRPRDLFFGEGPYGRPIIHGPDSATPLSFNLSHTRGLVGIAR